MKKCREEFEIKYPLPSGVVYLNGNYVAVVPHARTAARDVNKRYDCFRNGWKIGVSIIQEELLDEMMGEAEDE